jgi:hypothetical protein
LNVNQVLIGQLDPLTEQQVIGIYNLQQTSTQAEEALSQGLEQLQQSLVDTIAGVPLVDGMQQMAVALSKLANLEGFVRQVIKPIVEFFIGLNSYIENTLIDPFTIHNNIV